MLVVLFIVMVITITTLGFLSQSDVELACGQNMILRTEMDYLAESGLEHARGLILNPQDVSTEFWTGGTGLQLTSGSDFYDISVERDVNIFCNYTIDCDSYRLQGADTIGRSSVRAILRLDPCIAFWTGTSTTISSQIIGDVYCGGILTNNGFIFGDAFATDKINGTIIGRKNQYVTPAYPVAWPNLTVDDFESTYYIDLTPYSAQQIVDPNIPTTSFEPNEANPAGILYCADDVNMPGNVTINGTLVVDGKLTISGSNNIITAEKNFPALVVTGEVIMEDDASLVINGLAQIGQVISIDAGAATASIEVTGGLFINGGGITSPLITVIVKANPAIASIETWSATGVPTRWRPAAGAFYRSIERK